MLTVNSFCSPPAPKSGQGAQDKELCTVQVMEDPKPFLPTHVTLGKGQQHKEQKPLQVPWGLFKRHQLTLGYCSVGKTHVLNPQWECTHPGEVPRRCY
jgi:hypothetical protein